MRSPLGSHLFIVAIKALASNSHFFQSAILSGSTVSDQNLIAYFEYIRPGKWLWRFLLMHMSLFSDYNLPSELFSNRKSHGAWNRALGQY